MHFQRTSQVLMTLSKKEFEKQVEKGEFACNQHLLLLKLGFLPYQKQINPFPKNKF